MKDNNLLENLLPIILDMFVSYAGSKDGLQLVKIENERFVMAFHIKKKVRLFEFKDHNSIELLKTFLVKETA
ncbi:hypothetical protein LP085_08230 [Achromobacter sp. MY14]|uniref:hypothetical protein n=1 Tax=unclassified Achromobacter TaxID=2626865 RepID=UPI001E2B0FF6|nr:hypothetical protein [Achromobacter sp. MY14]MCD0496834.1 hypothetical protein [Achromobacter sp. MY14]